MGQTLPHKSMESKGAVTALACKLYQILSNKWTEENLLCDVWYREAWTEVTSRDIVKAVRAAAKTFKLQEGLIDPKMIGVHSL